MKNKKQNKNHTKHGKEKRILLPPATQRLIFGVAMFLAALIIILAFFNLAGPAGTFITKSLFFLVGKATFLIPLWFVLAGLIFLNLSFSNNFLKIQKTFYFPTFLGILLLILGISGILGSLGYQEKEGGYLGYIITWPLFKFFGSWATLIIFSSLFLLGGLIIYSLFKESREGKEAELKTRFQETKTPIFHLFNKVAPPKFKIKEIKEEGAKIRETAQQKEAELEFKVKKIAKSPLSSYQFPSLEFLEPDRGQPTSGDIIQNSAIIKRTLENFGIPVQMSEVYVGPTVAQYTLKPAEGVKLSKITTLSSDLSLALAAHPIRIEAPIPGRPLVGIEVPNKTRTQVRLRSLIALPEFQNVASTLNFVLGRDVAGNHCFADLRKMPHLLIAGSTGTGKTICLNTLITSLLYRNSPATLRFILIDPKRVEFTVYAGLPHLLAPVIFDAQKTINALRWLVKEMERRFIILADAKTRDITLYNELILKEDDRELLPFIVLIIDELADLMAARGKEMEAGIVRLAQMARAVGIHLVLATQRPSVEVITGLIKANITSRIAFQVASQIDSRTILDGAGAEKLLGAGDMLFVSAEIGKPKRIQGAYTSEKEVKKVTDFLRKTAEEKRDLISVQEFEENHLSQDLGRELESSESYIPTTVEGLEFALYSGDSLLPEAKRVVIEAKKASASLLQRRLRIGYARAARLLDILEEKGLVGPADGAKPREVYFKTGRDEIGGEDIRGEEKINAENEIVEGEELKENKASEKNSEDEEWRKV